MTFCTYAGQYMTFCTYARWYVTLCTYARQHVTFCTCAKRVSVGPIGYITRLPPRCPPYRAGFQKKSRTPRPKITRFLQNHRVLPQIRPWVKKKIPPAILALSTKGLIPFGINTKGPAPFGVTTKGPRPSSISTKGPIPCGIST